jgi:hypothetical protein
MRFGPTSTAFLAGIARRHDSEGRVGLEVRFGSKADMCVAKLHVRFTPESGHVRRSEDVRFGPIADLMRRERQSNYITPFPHGLICAKGFSLSERELDRLAALSCGPTPF